MGKLLEQGIFESPSNAKLRFPAVFEKTPVQISKSAASDQEVARSKAEPLDEPSELFDKEGAIFKSSAASAAKRKLLSKSEEPGANGVGKLCAA